MKQWKRRIVWLLLALCLFAGGCDIDCDARRRLLTDFF